MEADLEAIMAEARSVDSELAGGDTSDIVGLLVLDRAGLVVGQQGEVGAGRGADCRHPGSQARDGGAANYCDQHREQKISH